MNTADPLGVRARFIDALSTLDADLGGAARLCHACVRTLPVQRAAIAVQVEGTGLELLCASDTVAEQIEWVQIALGEGPGVDAIASGGPIMATDLATPAGRWPTFAAEAAAAGIGALYALPLEVGVIRVGVLDLYRDEPDALDDKEFADAIAVAELMTAILLTVGRSGHVTDTLDQWWDQPLSTREVHQATGMIMAQMGTTAHEAYVRMQAFAYANGQLLTDVASAVVGRRLRFDDDTDHSPGGEHDGSL